MPTPSQTGYTHSVVFVMAVHGGGEPTQHTTPAPALIERLCDEVAGRFGVKQSVVRVIFAPYRICPLGAHIDHQLGRVTAMALDCGISLAFAPANGREVRLRSLDFPGEVCFDIDRVPETQIGDWGDYARGAVRALQQRQSLCTGLVGITAGSIAEGGLSSSAAVSVAYLLALQHVNQLAIVPEQNIALAQRIENDYLGLRTGILDQAAILLSRSHCLTVIDCEQLRYELIPPASALPPYQVLIVSSGIRKALATTDYNQRVSQCVEAARVLLRCAGRSVRNPVLGHVCREEYHQHRDRLTGPLARRAAHFFSESQRVAQGIDAWRRGDLRRFGELITQSGASSIANYECGAPPLIDLYHSLVDTPGVLGARFSGAGFRGCCLALVVPELAQEVAARVRETYIARHPELAQQAWTMICTSSDSARQVR